MSSLASHGIASLREDIGRSDWPPSSSHFFDKRFQLQPMGFENAIKHSLRWGSVVDRQEAIDDMVGMIFIPDPSLFSDSVSA